MKFKDYYHPLEKKEKLIFYLITVTALFSFFFTSVSISFVGIKLFTLKGKKLPLGIEVPEIVLKDEKGEAVNITGKSQVKKLLLFFKPKCAACRMALSNLQYISKQYSPENIKIFCISEAAEEETKNFLKTYAINFPMLMDPQKSLRKIFKFHSTPALFLIDENSTIKYGRIGFRKLVFDEMVIKEFLQSSKIPIEIFESEDQ